MTSLIKSHIVKTAYANNFNALETPPSEGLGEAFLQPERLVLDTDYLDGI